MEGAKHLTLLVEGTRIASKMNYLWLAVVLGAGLASLAGEFNFFAVVVCVRFYRFVDHLQGIGVARPWYGYASRKGSAIPIPTCVFRMFVCSNNSTAATVWLVSFFPLLSLSF